MALAQFLSATTGEASLFVDTPEGFLDIAYESRAGEMLAKFALMNHRLIMTANINTSRLLLSLAEKCGRNKMKLCRMTSWTKLSEVQAQEEGLFNTAYGQIEKALNKRRKSA